MKKTLSLVLAIVMLASTLSLCFVSTFTASAAVETVVAKGQEWEYLAWPDVYFSDGTATIPEGALVGTDSETWSKGNAMFGEGRTTNFGYGNFASILRTTFEVADVASVQEMKMYIIYDENPTVYLNGEVVWAVNQVGAYHDSGYVEVDLSEHVGKLVNGTNYFCIAWEETYGGSVMDAELVIASGFVDENGYMIPVSTAAEGSYFNDQSANMTDWDANTVIGGTFSNTQKFTLTYDQVYSVGEIFVRCKNEGAAVNEDGSYGTYDIYAVKDNIPTKIATNVPAIPVNDNHTTNVNEGGYTITFEKAYEAQSIVIIPTSWTGPGWACVADFGMKTAAEGTALATTDCDGNPIAVSADRQNLYPWANAAPINVLDGNVWTICGAGYDANADQRVIVNYKAPVVIDSIYVESMNEGMDQLAEGVDYLGTADLYIISGGVHYRVATGVELKPEGGVTVELSAAYRAEGIAVKFTSWNTNKWCQICEVRGYAAEEGAEVAIKDIDGKDIITSIERHNIVDFGYGWNNGALLVDRNEGTVVGSGWNGEPKAIVVNFAGDLWFDSIKTTVKAEGYDALGDSCFGKASYYIVNDGVETLVAEGVELWTAEAVTEANKTAETVTFDATKGDAIKIVITDWYGGGWAAIAEMTYTTTEEPAEETLTGDFNGDGSVTIGDVTTLLDYLAGKGEVIGNADLNNDDAVTIGDVTALLDQLAGK